MKILKKILSLTLALFIFIFFLPHYNFKTISTSTNINQSNPIKVAVLLYDASNQYLSLFQKELENIQNENKDKVEFTFFDGKANLAIQYQIVDNLIQDGYDLLFLIGYEETESEMERIILKTNQKKIPVVFFLSTLPKTLPLEDYSNFVIVTANYEEQASLEGEILVKLWNADKKDIDKNNDDVLQYVMLQGLPGSLLTADRTKYSIEAINNAGIKTELLGSKSSKWNKELAKENMTSLFLQYGNNIEAIIANDDELAIGAIEALQSFGYNIGDKSKFIPVVGIDGLPQAQELIKKGFMTGTVYHDSHVLAESIFEIIMNISSGKTPIDGTNFPYDKTGIVLYLPLEIYTIENLRSSDEK